VIQATELACALDGGNILGVFDDADHGGVASRIAADPAAILLGDVAADLAEAHLLAYLGQQLRQPGDVERR